MTELQAPPDGVLLTGATGFVGMELLARYLERTDRQRVRARARGATTARSGARIARTLRAPVRPRSPLRGAGRGGARRSHPARPRPAAPSATRWREQVSEVVHGAASVSFELGLEASRAINVEGTRADARARRALPRARRPAALHLHLDRVRRGRARGLLQRGRPRRRPALSQRLRAVEVRGRAAAWPAGASGCRSRCCARASSSASASSGWTASFNVLYWPLRAFARGAYAALPARGDAPVDVVPVDYVADAIFALSQAREAEGATFHLTAGRARQQRRRARRARARVLRRPAPRLIDPLLYRRVVHPLLVALSPRRALPPRAAAQRGVLPVLRDEGALRRPSRARRAARRPGSSPAPLRDYFDRLVEFALAADWGRREIPRAGAHARRWRPGRRAARRGRRPACAGARGMSRARLSALDASFLAVETPERAHARRLGRDVLRARGGPAAELRASCAITSSGASRARRATARSSRRVPLGAARARSGSTTRPSRSIATSTGRPARSQSLVDEVMSMPLRRDRPLWEMWICEDPEQPAVRDRRQGPPLHGRRHRRGRARLAAARPDARAAGVRAGRLARRARDPAPSGCSRAGCATCVGRAARPAAAGRCAPRARPPALRRQTAAGALRVTRALEPLAAARGARERAQRTALAAAPPGLDRAPARATCRPSSARTARPSTTCCSPRSPAACAPT